MLTKIPPHIVHKIPHIAVRGEQYVNVVLISATSYHEWGNLVGYCCVPVVFFLTIHIICALCGAEE